MKKLLSALLALLMLASVALVACKKDNNADNNGDDNGDDNGGYVLNDSPSTSDTGTGTGTGNNSGSWEAAEYTIYSLATLNVRASDSANSEKLGQLNIGEQATALETDGDWYKISYGEGTAYVSADYVTRNQNEATFEACDATALKVKNEVKDANATEDADKYVAVALRTEPVVADSTASGIYLIFSDTQNSELQKVGQNKAGTWYKVTYKENTYYIGSGAFKYFEGYTGGNSGGQG